MVLDYGCAHGHYTINLAKRFPHLRFIGIDLVSSNLDAARRWAGEEKLDNVAFRLGTLDAHLETLPPLTRVIAAEVLEHVPHPATLADRLAGLLTPAGRMILTTPYGPWEAQGYAAHHPWRAHLHHLERADLEDMFAAHPGFSIEAVPAGQSPWGEALGSWITEYGKPASPYRRSGPMDLERKLRTQAPRETLSVCMIVKPDGDTLARTLKSVSAIADEVIIGIDDGRAGNPGGAADRAGGAVNRAGGAAGRAWQIAEDCGARAFSIASPLSVGFDTVRNTTIERASGDWILWIDDDEEFLWPERLPKYLRDNSYDAYAVKQHHYSVEPGGVLKTDFPCRLFRNRNGIRFHGLVHEHPERGLNQGAGRVLLLPDVAICHNGYVTEAVRRERFLRNLPLMRRDREANAARLLGRFLWIRHLAHLNRFASGRPGGATGEADPGCRREPHAPEVIQSYGQRSPRCLAAVFDGGAAAAGGQAIGDGTPVHITIPTDNPWVPLRILALGKQADDRVEADVFLLTAERPTPLPVRRAGLTLEHSEAATQSLLDDLRSDDGMGWIPGSAWLTKLQIDSSAGDLSYDLAIDASGQNSPSPVAAGLVAPSSAGFPETATLAGVAVLLLILISSLALRRSASLSVS